MLEFISAPEISGSEVDIPALPNLRACDLPQSSVRSVLGDRGGGRGAAGVPAQFRAGLLGDQPPRHVGGTHNGPNDLSAGPLDLVSQPAADFFSRLPIRKPLFDLGPYGRKDRR